ncbi:FliM/FliN family flagellar motor switch protein [Erythrobacteraceae bacterium CFH 75059]|uniref:FliM/FliN family flagellar motor C-terminal domain-containing protein n=1 Tax=Qipengyuania thermophila TaxID=2509361 RepID=UPI0010217F34|nr:FliM/FliN family flagellar motor C-terminal domain-containing protein [Qipengyuania thermophila]TCD06303.1 FliM/FliN family flagellar motor switch protein [Erythrobacteraceae bacterium CFH 75059]
MTPQPAFPQPRLLARHCAELVQRHGRPPRPSAVSPVLGRMLADRFAEQLVCVFADPEFDVRWDGSGPAAPIAEDPGAEQERHESALACAGASVPLAWCTRGLMWLTEHLFGGAGESMSPVTLPRRVLPWSLRLVAEELGARLADALNRACGAGTDWRATGAVGAAPAASDGGSEPVEACVSLMIVRAGEVGCRVTLSFGAAALRACGILPDPRVHGETDRADRAGQLAPFARDVPVVVRAIVAERRLPLSRVAVLRAGDLIPLPQSGGARLVAGGATIAEGIIGSADGCMMVRLRPASDMRNGAQS